LLLPPDSFIPAPMQFVVMHPAKWNREAVADLPPGRPVFREFDVMGIRGVRPQIRQGRAGDVFQAVLSALPALEGARLG
jgi:hypothetical protein